MTPATRHYAQPASEATWNTGCPSRINRLQTLRWDKHGSTTPPGSTSTRSASSRPRSSGVRRKQQLVPNRRWRPSRLQAAVQRRSCPRTLEKWTWSPARSAHRVHVSQRKAFDKEVLTSFYIFFKVRQSSLYFNCESIRCQRYTPHWISLGAFQPPADHFNFK